MRTVATQQADPQQRSSDVVERRAEQQQRNTAVDANEVAAEGICINAAAPAVIRTEILDQLTPAQVDEMVRRIPMKRTGKPEEATAVAHFLASHDSWFVTGQRYQVSGGRATY